MLSSLARSLPQVLPGRAERSDFNSVTGNAAATAAPAAAPASASTKGYSMHHPTDSICNVD